MTRHLPTIARILVGLVFALSGVTWFLPFVPKPPPPELVAPFMTGLVSTGYFLPLLKATEMVCGILLVANRFVPLALVILSPIVVQIAAFHFLFEHSGAPIAAVIVLLQIYLGWSYRNYFRGVVVAKAQPASHSPSRDGQAVPVGAN
ncbi:MAG TPA: DoxX family protein [Polyangiaceae bacterium]